MGAMSYIVIKTDRGSFHLETRGTDLDPPVVRFTGKAGVEFYGDALASIKTMIAIHAHAGIDVTATAYCKGVTAAVEHATKGEE